MAKKSGAQRRRKKHNAKQAATKALKVVDKDARAAPLPAIAHQWSPAQQELETARRTVEATGLRAERILRKLRPSPEWTARHRTVQLQLKYAMNRATLAVARAKEHLAGHADTSGAIHLAATRAASEAAAPAARAAEAMHLQMLALEATQGKPCNALTLAAFPRRHRTLLDAQAHYKKQGQIAAHAASRRVWDSAAVHSAAVAAARESAAGAGAAAQRAAQSWGSEASVLIRSLQRENSSIERLLAHASLSGAAMKAYPGKVLSRKRLRVAEEPPTTKKLCSARRVVLRVAEMRGYHVKVPEDQQAQEDLASQLAPRVCVRDTSSCSGFGYGDMVRALNDAASRGYVVLYDLAGVTRCEGETIQPHGGSTQGGFQGTLAKGGSTARAFTVFESIVEPMSGDESIVGRMSGDDTVSSKTSEMRARSLNHMVVERMSDGSLRPSSDATTWTNVCVVQHSSSSACKWKGGSISKNE